MFVVYTSIYQLNRCFVHIYNAWHALKLALHTFRYRTEKGFFSQNLMRIL